MSLARGLKNKNPLNMRYNINIPWQGQVGQDGNGYAVFDTMENGLRAAARDIRNLQKNSNVKTIRDLITKWAPPKGNFKDASGAVKTETNPTDNYIAYVSRQLNVNPDSPVDWVNNDVILSRIITAMVQNENGVNPIPGDSIMAAIQRAKT